MGKAGGILGIIAGIFGVFAAVITLFMGGIGSAFGAEGAGTIVGFGWGGVLFSFLAIIFGAVALAKSRVGGIGLIVSAILGAILGGTLVAICMALALIGGILATLAKRPVAPVHNAEQTAISPGMQPEQRTNPVSSIVAPPAPNPTMQPEPRGNQAASTVMPPPNFAAQPKPKANQTPYILAGLGLVLIIAILAIALVYNVGKQHAVENARLDNESRQSKIDSDGPPSAQKEQGGEQHATSIPAEEISKQLMKTAYGDYDQKYSCWKAKDADGQDYCMRIARTDKIMTNEGERIYVLATGGTVNEEGEPDGAHVQPGLVGAFVIKDAGNAYEVIASDPNIPMGAFGSAPDEWEFVQFGPSDYWGWQSQTGDMHQGYAGGSYVFLAIYGKKVRDIGGITSYFSNEGAVGDDSDEATSLETKLKIDTTATGVKVYPLLITVSGKEGGKKFSEKTWKIPFDEKQWKYVAPPDWPLADADY